MTQKRTVCLNCIDGRVQLPAIKWIKDSFDSDYVDMITEPGIDGFLSDSTNSIDDIARKVSMSIEKNATSVIFIVGHYDCKGNPVGEADHKENILAAADRLKEKFPEMDVVGLWVNSQWEVERL